MKVTKFTRFDKKFSKMTKNLKKDCETQEALMSQMYVCMYVTNEFIE